MAQTGISELNVIAYLDRAEVMWVRGYVVNDEIVEERRYLASNAQGPWQHQFLLASPCEFGFCPQVGTPRIYGSLDHTQITPPYMRREGGEWQIPVIDSETDPLVISAYNDPPDFIVGPDDRSYFIESEDTPLSTWVLAETDLGCHVPTWQLPLETDCRPGYVLAIAVDAAGFLHATGAEVITENNYQLVHWRMGSDNVERTELAPLPADTVNFPHGFAISESDELHVCRRASATESNAVVIYSHGDDANAWTALEVEDPDASDPNASDPGYCKLALALDGTAWLAWHAGSYDPNDPFRVASVVDDVITYEVVDMGALEEYASLTVDPMGRPWLAYRVPGPYINTFKVAHKDGDQWVVEEITPP
jgi:hypothetical protein